MRWVAPIAASAIGVTESLEDLEKRDNFGKLLIAL